MERVRRRKGLRDNLLDHEESCEITLCAQHTTCLVQVEAGVGVARDHSVADHVAGVEVQCREGEDLTTKRH